MKNYAKGRRCELTFSIANVKIDERRYRRTKSSEPTIYEIIGSMPFGFDSIGVSAYTIDKMCVDINKGQRIKVIGVWGGRLDDRSRVTLRDCKVEVLESEKVIKKE